MNDWDYWEWEGKNSDNEDVKITRVNENEYQIVFKGDGYAGSTIIPYQFVKMLEGKIRRRERKLAKRELEVTNED